MSKQIISEKAKPVMIQGTASSSGKSLVTAALCRIFHQDGYCVAPFKAQNMSNNSFVTSDGLEMGRAQAVQAFASGINPDVRMNPVLLKPSSDTGSQVVICGKPSFSMDAKAWHESRDLLRNTIKDCYQSLSANYEIIVIEGAGSPAEINLKKNDIVNMGMAKIADAPVIIVGDIDRGGVFASLVGTMMLLDQDEKERVKGFIINKFRGDVNLLKPGLDELEKLTGVPVLGVIPWINHSIDEEDGVTERFSKKSIVSDIDICIIRLPHISNYTDFIPLECISGVSVRWCDTKDSIGSPDLIIIPGTKATIADLITLKKSGIFESINSFYKNGGTVLGVCGGFQMMGKSILDPYGVESPIDYADGFGLLDMTTTFSKSKMTEQVSAEINKSCSSLFANCNKMTVRGYEIHMGHSEFGSSAVPFTSHTIENDTKVRINGIADQSGRALGTYLHGIFDSSEFLTSVINDIRISKGLPILKNTVIERKLALNKDIDCLADEVRNSIDLRAIYKVMGL